MTVQYPLWVPVLAVVIVAGLLLAVWTLLVCRSRDHRLISYSQWASAHPGDKGTLSVADAAHLDAIGARPGWRR